ncbi:MAG: bifunctional heptose 7-phosphate kinase/heptose 1-phosphate adenyltransferase, partial [Acetobacteraceae bacterium]
MDEQSDPPLPQASSDAALAPIVHGFGAARVLVVGDLILDRYVIGQAGRLSQEAPIPVLRPTATRATAGGAANVATNIAELGGQAVLVGLVGKDSGAAELRRLLAACPSIRAALVEAPGRPTTTKTRFMSGAHQLLRLDEESTDPADPATAAALCAACDAAMAEVAVVVLSDYSKGVLAGPVLDHVIAAAAAAGRPVIADPKRVDFAAYRGVTVLTPNEAELRLADGHPLGDTAAVEAAAARVLVATAGQAVLVTRSEKGMAMIRADAPPLHL